MQLFCLYVSLLNGWIVQAEIRPLLCSFPEVQRTPLHIVFYATVCIIPTVTWQTLCHHTMTGCASEGVAFLGPIPSHYSFSQAPQEFVGKCHTKKIM